MFYPGKKSFTYPLYKCVADNSISMLQLLLTYGADTEVRDGFGDLPLHLAAANGHEKALSLLLEHHIGMDKSSKSFWTAATCLQKAVQRGSDQENLYLRRVLWNAVERNEAACVKLLLSKGASVHGVFRGVPIIGKALLLCNQHTPLSADPTILKALIEYGADANTLLYGLPVLHHAVWQWTEDAIRVLVDAGADMDVEHGAPLKHAIGLHRLSVVKLLLERGASVNARTNSGMSILRFAKHHGSEETVELLIQYGAEDLEED